MPLTRTNTTRTVWALLIISSAKMMFDGVGYLTTPDSKTRQSPALAWVNDNIMGMRAWGVLFLIASLSVWTALLKHNRAWGLFGLGIAALTSTAWSVVLLAATVSGSTATYTGWTGPLFVAAVCIVVGHAVENREGAHD